MNYYIVWADDVIDFIVASNCDEQEVKYCLDKANDIFHEQTDECLEDIFKKICPNDMVVISSMNISNIYN